MSAKYLASVVFAVFFVAACSGEHKQGVVVRDNGFSLFEIVTIQPQSPVEFHAEQVTELVVVCDAKYDGYGHLYLVGRSGYGEAVGVLKEPVSGELGRQLYEFAILKGRLEIPLLIEMTSRCDAVALGVTLGYDSLSVDGQNVAWDSDEGTAVYWDDIPENTAFISAEWYIDVQMQCAN